MRFVGGVKSRFLPEMWSGRGRNEYPFSRAENKWSMEGALKPIHKQKLTRARREVEVGNTLKTSRRVF